MWVAHRTVRLVRFLNRSWLENKIGFARAQRILTVGAFVGEPSEALSDLLRHIILKWDSVKAYRKLIGWITNRLTSAASPERLLTETLACKPRYQSLMLS